MPQATTSGPRPRCSAPRPLSPGPTRFDVVRYPERLPEILELRRVAFGAAGKIAPGTPAAELVDSRDLRSSIVIAQSAGHLVGSLRLTPALPGSVLGQPELVGPLPGLPATSEYLECSRACIHPDHQGEGLCWDLAAHMLTTARKLGKPYLVAAIAPDLWRFWWRCGYRKTGIPYINVAFRGHENEVGVLDVAAALEGRTIDAKLARVLSPLLAWDPVADWPSQSSAPGAVARDLQRC